MNVMLIFMWINKMRLYCVSGFGDGGLMEFKGVKNYLLLELGLSQIYLNKDKIQAIEKWFNPDDMSIFEPLPVRDFGDGRYTLTDGHSRAYVAYKNGLTQIPIVYDDDDMVAGKIGQTLYQADIEWCKRFHIENIRQLENRILTSEEYLRLWIGRCNRSYDLLTQTTEEERALMKNKAPKLFLYGAAEDLSEIYFESSVGELFSYKNGLLVAELEK